VVPQPVERNRPVLLENSATQIKKQLRQSGETEQMTIQGQHRHPPGRHRFVCLLTLVKWAFILRPGVPHVHIAMENTARKELKAGQML
jgi:hypothetical protein